MKKVIFSGLLLASVAGLSSFTLKHDTSIVKHDTVADKKTLGTADEDKIILGTADDKKDLGTADARHSNVNDKKDLGTAD